MKFPASYRPDIDGLRAVAVLAVVIFHAAPSVFPGGFIGVDVFFVISGFLISTIILRENEEGSFTFSNFYARRIKRIFPALVVVLLTCWLVGWKVLLADEFAALGREIAAGAGFVANILFWKETDYFGTAAESRPLLHLWSLGVEEQFYIIWPIALWLARKSVRGAIYIIAIGSLASFGINVARVGEHQAEAFFLPHARLWELFIGAFLAYIARYRAASERFANTKAIIGAVLLAAGFLLLNKDRAFPGWWALLPTIGAFLLIWAGPRAKLNAAVLASRPAVFIGLISYPLYLWHWPLLAFARNMADGEPSLIVRAGLMLVAVVLAWLTYEFIEKPVRTGGLFGRRRVQAATTFAAVILGLGVTTQMHGGFVGRFPEIVQHLANYQYPAYTAEYRVASCFLKPEQPASEFQPDCVDGGFAAAPANVFLWGDSHAAHFYPGLRSAAKEQGFLLAQFNSAGCPPILGYSIPSRPNCEEINRHVLKKIAETKPHVVVISAHWPKYSGSGDIEKLPDTIRAARDAGAERIVLIGPVPNWRPSLPKLLLEAYQADNLHRVPTRMRTEMNDSIMRTDIQLAKLAAAAEAPYYSPMSLLCLGSACLTRLGDQPEDLTAWDYGHLTAKASRYVIASFFREMRPLSETR